MASSSYDSAWKQRSDTRAIKQGKKLSEENKNKIGSHRLCFG